MTSICLVRHGDHIDDRLNGQGPKMRVHTALNRIVTQHAGQCAVLMTHGGVIQVAFHFFFGYGDAAFRRAYPAAGHTSITH
jgi:2,3-bisphosphoglycerate-dependent phosphoglycerate mutase